MSARNPELEAVIEANPDDAGAYLVYADWLQSRGDPRGELIVLQHAQELDRAQLLLDRHAELCGAAQFHDASKLTWRWGYLETASIGCDELPELLEHPSRRFLRELVLRGGLDEPGRARAVSALERHALPTLRSLVLGQGELVDGRFLLGLGGERALYAAVRNLESLTLVDVIADGIALPRLRELIIAAKVAGGLATLYSAHLPMMERLSLQLGASIDSKALQPLLDPAADAFPRLGQLAIAHANIGDTLCERIATSRLASQLVMLDLSSGPMGDAGAAALAAGAFPKLQLLDVSRCFLTAAGLARLRPLVTTLIADDQRDDRGKFDNRFWRHR